MLTSLNICLGNKLIGNEKGNFNISKLSNQQRQRQSCYCLLLLLTHKTLYVKNLMTHP